MIIVGLDAADDSPSEYQEAWPKAGHLLEGLLLLQKDATRGSRKILQISTLLLL